MTPKITISKKMIDFSEWESIAEPEFSCEFGNGWFRDDYLLPNGIRVYHEVNMPYNIFKQQYERTVVDFLALVSTLDSLKEQGVSYIDESRYSDEGYGLAVFEGENSLERAYNYCNKFN